MIKLHANLKQNSYPVIITNQYNGIFELLGNINKNAKLIIITDTHVDACQGKELICVLEPYSHEIYKYVFPAGEKSKTLDTVEAIYCFLLDLHVDRQDIIIAFGGGVVGDLAGFVAATYLRGISFVQVPTTLLAQVDSSIGGKVGVNFLQSKNNIGAFYQPKFVYINLNALKTLPSRQIRSGLAEVIVHCIIGDSCLFEYIYHNFTGIFQFDSAILEHIISKNCSIKISVVEKDEKDNGLRAILNFGHTIGHAIESVYNFELSHGECVSIGIVGAFRIAQYIKIIDNNVINKVINLLKKIGLPYYLDSLDVEKVFYQMFFDKKISNNTLTFVLPQEIGKVVKYKVENEELIKRVLSELSKAPELFGS